MICSIVYEVRRPSKHSSGEGCRRGVPAAPKSCGGIKRKAGLRETRRRERGSANTF